MSFTELGKSRAFRPGEVIVRAGEDATAVYLMLTGYAKITATTIDGKPVLLDLRIGGELIGEFAAFDSQPRSATAIATNQVTTRFIRQAQFIHFLDENPQISREVSKSIVMKTRLSTSQRLDMNVDSVIVRVARVLDHLATRYALTTPDGLLIDVPLSQFELAELVGISQPHLQRALAYLRRRGAVLTRYRRPEDWVNRRQALDHVIRSRRR